MGTNLPIHIHPNKKPYIQWLSQIAEGLRALHEMKIIHCDLALRNILLTREDEAR